MSLRRGDVRASPRNEPRRSTWSAEEDQIIMNCIREGFSKWSDIGKKIPNERTGKQCRERWFNHLDPQLKKGPWTDEEDQTLIAAQRRIGNSWTKIASEMPGRSENEVKNRWYSAAIRNKQQHLSKKRRMADDAESSQSRSHAEASTPMEVDDFAASPPSVFLPQWRLPSLFHSSYLSVPTGELPNQLLLAPRTEHGADVTSPESATQQPAGDGSGLTTPLSFLGGALSAFNSGAGSPTWFEGGVSSTLSTQTGVSMGSADSADSHPSRDSTGGDSVTDALQLLLQGIVTGMTTTTTPETCTVIGADAEDATAEKKPKHE